MEGSTHYLYSEPALEFMSSMDQKPRIIVQLRDPAVRIWSHYNYIKQRSQTPITLEFSELVDRLLGTEAHSDEPLASSEWHNFLLKNQLNYSNYEMHLSKWMSRFPPENVFIRTLEELVENKRSIAGHVADWIGVDASFYDDYVFAARNTTRTQEAESLRRQLAGYSRLFPRTFVRKVKAVVDKALSASRPEPRVADEESLARLRQHFHAANERLARKFDVDITRWQEPG